MWNLFEAAISEPHHFGARISTVDVRRTTPESSCPIHSIVTAARSYNKLRTRDDLYGIVYSSISAVRCVKPCVGGWFIVSFAGGLEGGFAVDTVVH